jgi:hypothetical protein
MGDRQKWSVVGLFGFSLNFEEELNYGSVKKEINCGSVKCDVKERNSNIKVW